MISNAILAIEEFVLSHWTTTPIHFDGTEDLLKDTEHISLAVIPENNFNLSLDKSFCGEDAGSISVTAIGRNKRKAALLFDEFVKMIRINKIDSKLIVGNVTFTASESLLEGQYFFKGYISFRWIESNNTPSDFWVCDRVWDNCSEVFMPTCEM